MAKDFFLKTKTKNKDSEPKQGQGHCHEHRSLSSRHLEDEDKMRTSFLEHITARNTEKMQ